MSFDIIRTDQAPPASGPCSQAGAVKITVYLTDLAALPTVDQVDGDFFPVDPPARAVVEVQALPAGSLVAVQAVAVKH